MFGIGTQELIIVGIIVLVLFGHRLPTVMGSLGKGIRDFKRGMDDDTPDDDDRLEEKKKTKVDAEQ
jgi:sec-independent protein translocase protein TatA